MGHCFTTKEEGNLGLHVGDNPLHVNANRLALQKRLGLDALVFMDQVHGDRVEVITDTSITPICDAMLTTLPRVGLVVMAADCIPMLLWDVTQNLIGVVHAGRAGTALHVGQKSVLVMKERFGSRLDNIRIAMGPSIGVCCYEVRMDATKGLEKYLHVKDERYFLDLKEANVDDFLALGIPKKNIDVSPRCTCCGSGYFSYRKENITGRFGGVIWQ
jgi:YfiH family protein